MTLCRTTTEVPGCNSTPGTKINHGPQIIFDGACTRRAVLLRGLLLKW